MFEKSNEPLLSKSKFYLRLLFSILFGLAAIAIAELVGMVGYHVFNHLSWLDSFLNASMILSGMGQVDPLTTSEAKLFAGFYALFSGLSFIMFVGIIFTPVVHRFFHKFHLPTDE